MQLQNPALFFDNSGAQLSSKRTGVSSDHAAGDRQGEHQAAPGQGISQPQCHLGFQIWYNLGKHFLLVFYQVKAAAEILQNSVFRSRGVNRRRIENNKKKIIRKFHSVSFWGAPCMDSGFEQHPSSQRMQHWLQAPGDHH